MEKHEREVWGVTHPSKDIVCKTCKYKLKESKLLGERYTYGKCDIYEDKPNEILFDNAKCEFYQQEEENN
jgi:hypothetical protein